VLLSAVCEGRRGGGGSLAVAMLPQLSSTALFLSLLRYHPHVPHSETHSCCHTAVPIAAQAVDWEHLPGVCTAVANPYNPAKSMKGPLPITFDLPKSLQAGPASKDSEVLSSGFTLAMQLMPGGEPGVWQLVLWTQSQTVWACESSCPAGVTSGR
jgi:hypothetical protein